MCSNRDLNRDWDLPRLGFAHHWYLQTKKSPAMQHNVTKWYYCSESAESAGYLLWSTDRVPVFAWDKTAQQRLKNTELPLYITTQATNSSKQLVNILAVNIPISYACMYRHFCKFFFLGQAHVFNCHSLSLASVKSRLVLPFWYRLTRVVLEKGR